MSSPGGKAASNTTDLRGIWESKIEGGIAVVVAEKNGHTALHRGTSTLGSAKPRSMKKSKPSSSQKKQIEDLLRGSNKQVEEEYWHNNRRSQQGVEIERTKF